MKLVFTYFFGRNDPNYTTYLFCGILVFSYFSESSTQGMSAIILNADILTKINVSKYLFLFSKNIQTLINFFLTLIVFFIFCIFDHISFGWHFLWLIYPISCLALFNCGMGLILSALYVFFRDIQYLWSIMVQLINYASAIFYSIESLPSRVQTVFMANPVYLYINYFRNIVIKGIVPSFSYHLWMAFVSLLVLGIGLLTYRKYDHEFLYYL